MRVKSSQDLSVIMHETRHALRRIHLDHYFFTYWNENYRIMFTIRDSTNSTKITFRFSRAHYIPFFGQSSYIQSVYFKSFKGLIGNYSWGYKYLQHQLGISETQQWYFHRNYVAYASDQRCWLIRENLESQVGERVVAALWPRRCSGSLHSRYRWNASSALASDGKFCISINIIGYTVTTT